MTHERSAHPCRFIVKHWQLLAMQDGYTLHTTVIEAVPVDGGFLPAFVGKRDTRVVVQMATPLPTQQAARNSLRDVLGCACRGPYQPSAAPAYRH